MPKTVTTPKTLHLVTLGCAKNRVDSEVMLGTLAKKGYLLVLDPAQAEVIVVNTCSFIRDAKEESIQTILEMAELKRTGRCETLLVAGCLPQRHAEELERELPEVDHFVGTGAYAQVADLLAAEAMPRTLVPDPEFVHSAKTPRINSMPPYTAFVKVSEGCDNRCAFCVIPAIRGRQRSRPVEDIVAEARKLAKGGAVELNLIAQDLTAYGHDLPGKPKLAQLLRALVKVKGPRWIRLHYAYPRELSDELIAVIAGEEKVVKYLDMPLQHISDPLLRAMRRGKGSRYIRELLARLRERVPGIVLRTPLIAGLPGGGHPGRGDGGAGARQDRPRPAARADGHPAAHQPRAEPRAHRQAGRGARRGRLRGDRAPARRPHGRTGHRDRRHHLHQRRGRPARRDRSGGGDAGGRLRPRRPHRRLDEPRLSTAERPRAETSRCL